MLGAAHSAANPLTAHHGVVHGQAVGVMLPAVIRFNAERPEARAAYIDLAHAAGLRRIFPYDPIEDADRRRSAKSSSWRSFPRRSVADPDFPALAEEASRQWTAQFNPRPIAAGDFARLYEEALS